MVDELAKEPFALIGMNVDEMDGPTLQKELDAKGVNWRNANLKSGENPICDKFAISGFPTIFVIDKKGVIRGKDVFGSELHGLVKQLLAE